MVVVLREQVELGEDARDVPLDGLGGEEQPLADRLIGSALGHQLEHLSLPFGELVDPAGVAPAPSS